MGPSLSTVALLLRSLEKRGVVLSGGDGQIRGGVQLLKGTDADLDLDKEMAGAVAALAAKDSGASSA